MIGHTTTQFSGYSTKSKCH